MKTSFVSPLATGDRGFNNARGQKRQQEAAKERVQQQQKGPTTSAVQYWMMPYQVELDPYSESKIQVQNMKIQNPNHNGPNARSKA